MKKLISLIISLLLITLLVGCGSEETQVKDLEIGQTAEFETYSITLDSIELNLDKEVDIVKVKVKAKEDFSFNTLYLTAHFDDSLKSVSTTTTLNDNEVRAGESKEFELSFPKDDYNSIEWKDGKNQAIWTIDEIPEVEPEEETKEVVNNTANEFQAGAAWGAIEEVGKEEFPYGFEIKWFSGVIAVDPVGENSYFMKAYCEVTNAYGATAKDQVVEATVTGTGENIYNYTVEGFTVY